MQIASATGVLGLEFTSQWYATTFALICRVCNHAAEALRQITCICFASNAEQAPTSKVLDLLPGSTDYTIHHLPHS